MEINALEHSIGEKSNFRFHSNIRKWIGVNEE